MKEHVRATIDTEVSIEGKATIGIFISIKFEVFLSFGNSDFLVSTIASIFDLNMIIWKITHLFREEKIRHECFFAVHAVTDSKGNRVTDDFVFYRLA